MPVYDEILNIVSHECGKKTFQLTRKLFTLNGNLARQRCHLFFNHRCKEEEILPKSLRFRPPVRNHEGFELCKRFGLSFVSLRIKENHRTIKQLNSKIEALSKEIMDACTPRLWRNVSRNLKQHADNVLSETKEKHHRKLDELRKNSEGTAKHAKSKSKKNDWVVNKSSKKLSDEEISLLSKGLNFAVAPSKVPIDQFIAETESSISNLSSEDKSEVRNKVCSILSNAKPPKPNISKKELEALKSLKSQKDIIILKADKAFKLYRSLISNNLKRVCKTKPSLKCTKVAQVDAIKSQIAKEKEKLDFHYFKWNKLLDFMES
ncbi:hypothetical protein AC249_AIPGENE23490 [Exaiptasia diaphana]|nr:hypothetical protein AC249_AIPGENE23490 [Exaiptasia diaphana]